MTNNSETHNVGATDNIAGNMEGLDWQALGLSQPVAQFREDGTPVFAFEQERPEFSVWDALVERGWSGALWLNLDSSIDPDEVDDDYCLEDYWIDEFRKFDGGLEQAREIFGLAEDLSPTADAVIARAEELGPVESYFGGPFQNAWFVAAPVGAARALEIWQARTCENVESVPALAAIVGAWEEKWGAHIVGLGDAEEPDLLLRFPQVGQEKEAIVASLSAVADDLSWVTTEEGDVLALLLWD